MKSAMRQSKRGLTLVELVIAMMVCVILLAVAIPAFQSMLQRSQLDAAVRQVMSDARTAQSSASLTGWQYCLIGYDKDSGSTYKNQYRLIGKSPTTPNWPGGAANAACGLSAIDTVATFTSATQMAGPWINVNTVYPDVKLDTADGTDRFFVPFSSNGAVIAPISTSFPLNLSHKSGQKQCLGITAAGSIRMVNIGSVGCP